MNPLRLEIAQQLDHRQVAALVERAAERRVLAGPQERVGGARVVLDALAGEGLEHAAHQHTQVGVVAVVVLVDRPAEPRVVLVVRGLPRLLRAQRLVLLGHLGEAHQDEAELDRHRLLAPERAVVVVDGDPLGGRDVVRPAFGRHALDEVDDRRARRRVVPGRQVLAHCDRISISAWRSRSTYGSPLTSTATRLIVPPVKAYGDSPG